MRTLLVPLLTACGLAVVPVPIRADLAPPVPPPKDVKFTVEVDENAKAPKLIVPQNLTNVRFRPGGPRGVPGAAPPPGKEPLAVLEFEDDANVAAEPDGWNSKHLMTAGVALTLSLGLGGVWLVRRQGRGSARGLALLVAAGTTLAASTLVWANAPPPKSPPPPARKEVVVLPMAFDGKVNLEVAQGGDTIRLVLDKATYEAVKKDPKKPGAR
jgi:hypothetical protein